MPAPTALLRKPEELAEALATPLPAEVDNELVLHDVESVDHPASVSTDIINEDTNMNIDEEGRPRFAPATAESIISMRETRKITIPPHRVAPVRKNWEKIRDSLVEGLGLDVRMVPRKNKYIEIRTSKKTTREGALQTGEDFVEAIAKGFEVEDAMVMLKKDDIYIETFEIKDVKRQHGNTESNTIGRIVGKDGKTKFAIENTSRTRIVVADQKISIMGGFKDIRIARVAIVDLIRGKPPGKIYGNLGIIAGRRKERF